jgi:hypothetical protein
VYLGAPYTFNDILITYNKINAFCEFEMIFSSTYFHLFTSTLNIIMRVTNPLSAYADADNGFKDVDVVNNRIRIPLYIIYIYLNSLK